MNINIFQAINTKLNLLRFILFLYCVTCTKLKYKTKLKHSNKHI